MNGLLSLYNTYTVNDIMRKDSTGSRLMNTVYVLVLLMLPFVDQLYYTPCLPTLINNYLFNIPVNGIRIIKKKLKLKNFKKI
jgi:hypothetical protein